MLYLHYKEHSVNAVQGNNSRPFCESQKPTKFHVFFSVTARGRPVITVLLACGRPVITVLLACGRPVIIVLLACGRPVITVILACGRPVITVLLH
jgi:hypothetical protein